MNWDQIEGKWTEMKGRVQERWGELTDDQLNIIEGKRNELVGLIQQSYGVAREEAEKQADEFARTCDSDA